MVSIVVFLVSLAGLIALMSLRLWEMRHGARCAQAVRGRLDSRTIRVREYVRTHTPTPSLSFLSHAYHHGVHLCAIGALFVLRAVERRVVRVLEYVRGKREVQRGVTGSDFLKSVSEHKQSLGKPGADSVE